MKSPTQQPKTNANRIPVSPKTPEQLMSNQRLERNEAHLIQSKSISGSGERLNRGMAIGDAHEGSVEFQGQNTHKMLIQQELQIGQDVLNHQYCS